MGSSKRTEKEKDGPGHCPGWLEGLRIFPLSSNTGSRHALTLAEPGLRCYRVVRLLAVFTLRKTFSPDLVFSSPHYAPLTPPS